MSTDDDDLAPDAEVFRYNMPPDPGDFVTGDPELVDAITEHIARHFGEPEMVFHEIISTHVHIDVHHVRPTPERPYHVLVTSGMSAKPMTLPKGVPSGFAHAELMLCLPETWPLTSEAFEDDRHYWPLRWLKMLARFPHQYGTWLSDAHTVPNGDPAEPLGPGTQLAGFIVLPPFTSDIGTDPLILDDGRVVRFWSLLPLHADEMDFKLRKGADALLEKLDAAGVTDPIDPQRPSVVAKKKWWPF